MASNAQAIVQFPHTTDDLLERKLQRFLELKEAASEYEKLKKELKPVFQGEEQTNIGRFKITGKWVSRKECVIPATKYWNMSVKVAL